MMETKKEGPGSLQMLFRAYLRFLKEKPIITKSLTSGLIAGIGDVIAQRIVDPSAPYTFRSTAAFAVLGTFFTGPLSHYFYAWLQKTFPGKDVPTSIKKILCDRLVFAPPYLLAFFYLLGILEGKGHAQSVEKIRETYWIALKMNWRIWTISQYININYVPLQFRVLFASMIAFIWTIYLAVMRRR
ncbi:peroxisomal membrane protein 2-like [Lytechinus variegatus]|uniref:peroxisomal membrane protein 2-like n=1 Tax=Lytechinus variegatus TaxID=7654 RepID=UPI001BB20970|nr:peroxisomal membrane protein 2-like [Lytechinus variegatus]